jgi:hypothetical protein
MAHALVLLHQLEDLSRLDDDNGVHVVTIIDDSVPSEPSEVGSDPLAWEPNLGVHLQRQLQDANPQQPMRCSACSSGVVLGSTERQRPVPNLSLTWPSTCL